MLKPKEPHDEDKSDFLHPLQRDILLFFAINEHQNRHATAIEIKEHLTSVKKSFKTLEKSELIKKIDKRKSLGRERDCYWLTDMGVFLALIEGAEPKRVLNKTKEVYPENKLLQCVVETTSVLGTDMHRIAYSSLLSKGKLDVNDKGAMKGALLQKELSLQQIQELIAIMKRYPEQFGNMQDKLNEMVEKTKKVQLFLQGENRL